GFINRQVVSRPAQQQERGVNHRLLGQRPAVRNVERAWMRCTGQHGSGFEVQHQLTLKPIAHRSQSGNNDRDRLTWVLLQLGACPACGSAELGGCVVQLEGADATRPSATKLFVSPTRAAFGKGREQRTLSGSERIKADGYQFNSALELAVLDLIAQNRATLGRGDPLVAFQFVAQVRRPDMESYNFSGIVHKRQAYFQVMVVHQLPGFDGE